jgi:hypothetical protein
MIIKTSTDCLDQCPWFEADIRIEKGQPAGFEAWVKKIVQCKHRIILPDTTYIDYKTFYDSINLQMKNNDLTNYLLNRYNEL